MWLSRNISTLDFLRQIDAMILRPAIYPAGEDAHYPQVVRYLRGRTRSQVQADRNI